MIRMTTAILTAMAMLIGSVATAQERERDGSYNERDASYDSDRGTRDSNAGRRDESRRSRSSRSSRNWRSGSGAASEAEPYLEKGYAFVLSVDRTAKTLWLLDNRYYLTNATEFLNEVGQPASLREVAAQRVINGVPDRDTGSVVYFEADRNHGLLKLRLLEAMPR